jgi:hypothetical protein
MRASSLVVLFLFAAALPMSAQTPPADSPYRRHQSLLHVAGYAAGGMVLGAWGGYMASQIARSDWTDTTGRGMERLRFSLGGAALGLLAGIILGTRGSRIVLTPRGQPRLPLPTNGPITAEQIRSSPARTLSELLHELRPRWVRAEGTQILLPNGAEVATRGGAEVYLNGTLLGGLETLDKVSIDTVTEIQFLDGQAAALRYGAGAEDGAILLTTAPSP